MFQKSLGSLLAVFALLMSTQALAQEKAQGAAQLFNERCSVCHDDPKGRAPGREYLAGRLPSEVVYALSRGVMRQQAAGLSADQIRALAVFLTGRPIDAEPDPKANMCAKDGGPVALAADQWSVWGGNAANTRFQPKPGISAADLPRLKVKWAFGLPGLSGEPIVAGNRLFVASRLGRVFALDAKTGCTYWSYESEGSVRSALAVGRAGGTTVAAFFGDQNADVRALDSVTGKLLWQTHVDPYPGARIVGAVTYYAGRVYAPVTSGDETDAIDPTYECCKFRGSVVALDAATGKILWKAYTIQEEPKPTRKNSVGTQMYGPSGGGVWSAPTVDPKRKLIYAASGDAYSNGQTDATDAVMAFDMETGKRVWASQVVKNDAWLYRCGGQVDAKKGPVGNCPSPMGPDFDFSSPPMLVTLESGKQILVAGSKAAEVWAFDPDNKGAILWHAKVGKGSSNEPIWGLASDGTRVYAGTPGQGIEPTDPPGGLTAIDAAAGEKVWHIPAPTPVCAWGEKACEHRQTAAVTAIPGAVISGSTDAHLRAYAAGDGKIVWDLDTAKTYDAVNGIKAFGGNIDGSAQIVSGGTLFVNSGNASQTSPHRGDAVLAITVDGK
ncbi:MAG TPA: PQQ-binding-like beta-propeller repeat protein [Alphaproteobacteria bacterium]|nr:PQQ-binding-like beta-propeller repeat protein [Alphaproteobacteria bacterium]